jgi:uncharacterized protein YfaS (alpha-2-macroglobulin family)
MPRLFLALAVLAVLLAATFGNAESATLSAVYFHNRLSISVPHQAAHSGEAELRLELLDPEDRVLGEAKREMHVAEENAVWDAKIALPAELTLDKLVWHRLRYMVHYKDQSSRDFDEIFSLSEILERPVLRVLGQRSYIAGAHAAMRIIVSSSRAQEDATVIKRGTVKIELLDPKHGPKPLFTGALDRRGSCEADFHFPEGLTGNLTLRFSANTPIGRVETSETVEVEDKISVLLTSEKPIYQPSQTIHLRALALNRADRHAAGGRALTFEVEDPRGNKVFRNETSTDDFGVASAEFRLADEVNLGAYHVRAKTGETGTNTAELTVNVQRYVLPKFRVAIEFDSKNGKQKRDYRPGDHVTGVVKANYFFGKSVDNASVTIKALGMDAELFDAASAKGHTDREGIYHFDLALPQFFAGNGKRRGAASIVVEATVKDAADQSETRGEPITVSQTSLLISAVPEGGKLVRGLENEVFVLASYPDGTPAKADLEVDAGDKRQRVKTDEAGIATIQIPGNDSNNVLRIAADDRKGNRASESVTLETRAGEDQVLLRTAHAVIKPGDRMEITVLSTRRSGAAYIDFVHDGQTILTRDVDLENGRAQLNLIAGPEMSGTLMINAYVIGRNGRDAEDQRLVFVEPADELHIEAAADARSYLPGSEAKIDFRVTNQKREGVSAALGLEIVDQAVFALAEKQPGFAKVFFYLEQELMKPHYEIHSLSSSEIVEPAADGSDESRDRAARALFAAAETVSAHTLQSESGRTLPETEKADYMARYQNALLDYVQQVAAKISHLNREQDVAAAFKQLKDSDGHTPRDAWGTELRVSPAAWWNGKRHLYRVTSAGPDRTFDTADDLTVWLESDPARVSNQLQSNGWASAESSITMRMEHGVGPDNGLSEIDGTVTDSSGAVVSRARVQVQNIGDKSIRNIDTGAAGNFSFAALPPGRYRVQVEAAGFSRGARVIYLSARDRGVLSVTLEVGRMSEAVEVMAEAGAVVETEDAAMSAVIARENIPLNGRNPAPYSAMDARARQMKDKQTPNAGKSPAAEPGGHIRSFFPEALYINPEIITNRDGKASITIPLADSITTWRMAMLASTQAGALGTGTSELRVFQDFFVDLDLPVTLTQGDTVTIPVAVYNYASHGGEVELRLASDDWFSLEGPEQQAVSVGAGQIGVAHFTIAAKNIGKFKLTLTGRMRGASGREDTVVREIEVAPNGEAKEIVSSGRLDSSARQTVRFPESTIPEASKIFVRLYPGPLSQVIEGMDSILRMPFGCFEQTSSATYPNVLALDYMKRTKKLTPEIHAKAEGFVATGYQRLLTFEVPGGGFSWFGNAPANKILTAYGLMEFHDMANVYDVDPQIIARTRDWLVRQQQPDGGWNPDTQFINEGATNRFNADLLRITAYIAWALESAEYKGPAIENARRFIEKHLDRKMDAYTLAVVANFAVENEKESGRNSELAHRALELLSDAASRNDEFLWWSADETSVYATGESAAVETTGLALQAFLKAGGYSDVVRKSLGWIASKKNGEGNWGTTQATIMALRALLRASEASGSDARGTADILLNGAKVATLEIDKNNNDLFHQFVLPQTAIDRDNEVEIRFSGEGGLAYQIAGRYFIPWQHAGALEPLAIDVKYDRTRLAQDELVKAIATIRNNLNKTAKMVMVDLGIPPGFELLSEDLQKMAERTANAKSGRLEKFNMTATQAILYFDSIAPRDSFEVQYRLRAKYPIRAQGFASRVYEYYDPSVHATARPVQFEVSGH